MQFRFITLASAAVLASGMTIASKAGVIPAPAESRPDDKDVVSTAHEVSGTGVHYFATAMIHSQELTPTGMIQKSTDIVELSGDLTGRILYQPVSVFDSTDHTVVNTGHQVFSGTILGSAPVMIHDDEFRFEVNLNAGAEVHGEVHLRDHIAGPKIRCDLSVTGDGETTPEGNGIVQYTGTCTFQK